MRQFLCRIRSAMKLKFISLLIIIILLLSSCADVVISYNLTGDDSLEIDYSISVSSDRDISGYMSSIKKYWTDMGFSVEDKKNGGAYTLNGNKTTDYDSRGSAVKELSAILTDKDSLFYDVKFIYTPSYFEDIYDLSASIFLKDILRKGEGVNIPAAEIESLLEGTEAGNYKLSITLPGEVIETNADERNGQTCTWLLKYGENKYLKLSTKRVFSDNVSHYAALNEAQSRDSLFFIIGCSAAILLLLIIIIIAAVKKSGSKKVKTSEIYVERF